MEELRKEMIMNTAEDIKKYIWDKHAVDVDTCDIAYFINDGLGFLFGALEEWGVENEQD